MNIYIVSYDITDDDRRDAVFQYMRRWGDHLQYSVFRAELSESDRAEMMAELRERIDSESDQILLFDLGPTDGRARESVLSLGVNYTHPERHAIVV